MQDELLKQGRLISRCIRKACTGPALLSGEKPTEARAVEGVEDAVGACSLTDPKTFALLNSFADVFASQPYSQPVTAGARTLVTPMESTAQHACNQQSPQTAVA